MVAKRQRLFAREKGIEQQSNRATEQNSDRILELTVTRNLSI